MAQPVAHATNKLRIKLKGVPRLPNAAIPQGPPQGLRASLQLQDLRAAVEAFSKQGVNGLPDGMLLDPWNEEAVLQAQQEIVPTLTAVQYPPTNRVRKRRAPGPAEFCLSDLGPEYVMWGRHKRQRSEQPKRLVKSPAQLSSSMQRLLASALRPSTKQGAPSAAAAASRAAPQQQRQQQRSSGSDHRRQQQQHVPVQIPARPPSPCLDDPVQLVAPVQLQQQVLPVIVPAAQPAALDVTPVVPTTAQPVAQPVAPPAAVPAAQPTAAPAQATSPAEHVRKQPEEKQQQQPATVTQSSKPAPEQPPAAAGAAAPQQEQQQQQVQAVPDASAPVAAKQQDKKQQPQEQTLPDQPQQQQQEAGAPSEQPAKPAAQQEEPAKQQPAHAAAEQMSAQRQEPKAAPDVSSAQQEQAQPSEFNDGIAGRLRSRHAAEQTESHSAQAAKQQKQAKGKQKQQKQKADASQDSGPPAKMMRTAEDSAAPAAAAGKEPAASDAGSAPAAKAKAPAKAPAKAAAKAAAKAPAKGAATKAAAAAPAEKPVPAKAAEKQAPAKTTDKQASTKPAEKQAAAKTADKQLVAKAPAGKAAAKAAAQPAKPAAAGKAATAAKASPANKGAAAAVPAAAKAAPAEAAAAPAVAVKAEASEPTPAAAVVAQEVKPESPPSETSHQQPIVAAMPQHVQLPVVPQMLQEQTAVSRDRSQCSLQQPVESPAAVASAGAGGRLSVSGAAAAVPGLGVGAGASSLAVAAPLPKKHVLELDASSMTPAALALGSLEVPTVSFRPVLPEKAFSSQEEAVQYLEGMLTQARRKKHDGDTRSKEQKGWDVFSLTYYAYSTLEFMRYWDASHKALKQLSEAGKPTEHVRRRIQHLTNSGLLKQVSQLSTAALQNASNCRGQDVQKQALRMLLERLTAICQLRHLHSQRETLSTQANLLKGAVGAGSSGSSKAQQQSQRAGSGRPPARAVAAAAAAATVGGSSPRGKQAFNKRSPDDSNTSNQDRVQLPGMLNPEQHSPGLVHGSSPGAGASGNGGAGGNGAAGNGAGAQERNLMIAESTCSEHLSELLKVTDGMHQTVMRMQQFLESPEVLADEDARAAALHISTLGLDAGMFSIPRVVAHAEAALVRIVRSGRRGMSRTAS